MLTLPKRNCASLLLLFLPSTTWGQATATVTGTVTDPARASVPGVAVTVSNPISGLSRSAVTSDGGTYTITNLPFNVYTVTTQRDGFASSSQQIALRSNVPATVDIKLVLTERSETASVNASEQFLLINPEATGTRTELSQAMLEKLPVAPGNRGVEAVLLTFPGFAQNANGAIHPRGAHNQMTFVVDGMPITDQLTGAFATSLDTNIVQNIELFTGDTPAEFGLRTAAVANITTRTGLDAGRMFQGSLQLAAAQFGTLNQLAQFTGGNDKFGYFASFSAMKSNRFLDSVSLDNLHNGGNAERLFSRLDYRASARDILRFNLMAGRSSFELANLRSQHAAGQDQRQLFKDWSASIGWLRTVNARTTLDFTTSFRTSQAWLFGSRFDTPVTADQARRLSTFNIGGRFNTVRGIHTLRMGADYQYFPVSENFFFGITALDFNDPESAGYNPGLRPHDLSRGGSRFQFARRGAGHLPTLFFQDTIRWKAFTFSTGLREDVYRFQVNGSQLQPRLGIAYAIRQTGTVFRASYNRTYQTPPNENLLLSASEEAARLAPPAVQEALNGATAVKIRPETQNFYEVGLQQSIGRVASINASYYYKSSNDQQDNDNFLNTGIIFPITLSKIRVNGAELRLNVPNFKRFSGTLSMTHYHAISTPPFTGGLFLGASAIDALTAGPFVIDHDQTLGLQGNLQRTWRSGFWTSGSVRHDTGLVSNRSDPARVAADPDYYDLLPYVNLGADPPRVRPRTILDCAVGYDHMRDGRRRWDAQLQVTNLTDKTALFNFQSIFVGTRVVQPRTLGLKLRWYF
jgi:outer membrane receptor for Fe3+-dicitrate